VPILSHVSQGFLSGIPSDYSAPIGTVNGEEIRASMIDELSTKHFPICMRNMHDHLRRERHLKYQGRLQYGLFLKVPKISFSMRYLISYKVLGLSIEESLLFWRGGFRNLSDDEFSKKYKYNVRHSYGLEGKRVNYPARRWVLP
jgi:DNA primase large subunit